MAARALRLPPEHRKRAKPKSERPFRKRRRCRERRRRVWRFPLPARRLRGQARIAARPSHGRQRFESRHQSPRTARIDRAAAQARTGKGFAAARSWLCGASSIRQLGFGFGERQTATQLEEGAARTKENRPASEGGPYKGKRKSKRKRGRTLRKCLQNEPIGI